MSKIVFALALVLVIWSLPLRAIEHARMQIGQWSFADFSASQFDLAATLSDQGLIIKASTKTLLLPEPWQQINDVLLTCKTLRWHSGQIDCQAGQLAFSHPRYGKQQMEFSVLSSMNEQSYQVTLKSVRLAGAKIDVKANINADNWLVDFSADKLDLKQIKPLLADWLSKEQLKQLESYTYQGNLDVDGSISGAQSTLTALNAKWQAANLGFSNADGTQVTELVAGKGELALRQSSSHWQGELNASFSSGQLYSDPIFIDLTQQPLSIKVEADAARDFSTLTISRLQLSQPGVVDALLSIGMKNSKIETVDVTRLSAEMATFYPTWLQPFAVGSALAKLTAQGHINAAINWQPEHYNLQLQLDDVSLADENGRFSFANVDGQIDWGTDEKQRSSQLSWQSAQMLAIPIGAAAIHVDSQGQSVTLNQDLTLPVMDGALMVNDFSLQRYDSGLIDWTFDGMLTPISMEKLTGALGWPTFQGKLSGVIPDVRYQNQQLTIGGALQMKVFDGITVIRNLSMTTPLGSLPQLNADIDMTNLDLQLLTSAFDMGRITGRVDGYVHNLRLANWKPVQFDAKLETAKTNPGKRLISQTAVDNLTQIGGGATGMLSRSFLRFFDDFSYQRLGLSCHLRNGICQMQGIGEAAEGYYIVKGGGGLPPWINVVGYTRQVDWADLIARLTAAQTSDGPVIQ